MFGKLKEKLKKSLSIFSKKADEEAKEIEIEEVQEEPELIQEKVDSSEKETKSQDVKSQELEEELEPSKAELLDKGADETILDEEEAKIADEEKIDVIVKEAKKAVKEELVEEKELSKTKVAEKSAKKEEEKELKEAEKQEKEEEKRIQEEELEPSKAELLDEALDEEVKIDEETAKKERDEVAEIIADEAEKVIKTEPKSEEKVSKEEKKEERKAEAEIDEATVPTKAEVLDKETTEESTIQKEEELEKTDEKTEEIIVEAAKEAKVEVEEKEEVQEIKKPESEVHEAKEEKADKKEVTEEHVVEEKEEKKGGFFSKIKEKLTTKTIDSDKFDELFWDLEIVLLENNVSVKVIERIKEDLSEELVDKPLPRNVSAKIEEVLAHTLKDILSIETVDVLAKIKEAKKEGKPFTIIFFGINGSGKTTTIAKLVHYLKSNNLSVVLAAGDTFRAAAIDQLQDHADRLEVKMIRHDYGSDSAAVAYDARKYAEKNHVDVVLIDTAGRLHSNANLMAELEKMMRVAKPDMKIFIGESITGNDCVEQAEKYEDTLGIDGVILTKADIDEMGGAPLSICYVTGKPILFLGMGQEYKDLVPFSAELILEKLGIEG